MYPGDVEEYVSVIGTDAFMEFVESIQAEGVELERKAMGGDTRAKTPLVVEIDHDNKDIDALDIEIPLLTPRVYREYKHVDQQGFEKYRPASFSQLMEGFGDYRA